MRKRKANFYWWLVVNVCRLVLAITFIFSGTVKLIDPQGVQYKLEDYALAFGVHEYVQGLWAMVLALALSMLEFMLGIYVFFGIRRRKTMFVMLLFMLVMTPLTLYLAVANPVTDCGCFGDAIKLTNWQTFGKNVVLLAMNVVLLFNLRRMTRFISERNQWLISLYSLLFGMVFAGYNLYRLPVVDFRPYHVGADLLKGIMDERYGTDTSMQYIDFAIQSLDGEDITETWLGQKGYKFLLVAPYLPMADDANTDRINDLYEYSQKYGYPFLCLTSSTTEDMEQWRDATGAEYPIAWADGVVLKTVIRSNPGLLLLQDGTIVMKYAHTQLPEVQRDSPRIEDGRQQNSQHRSYFRDAFRLLLWFLLPLFSFSFLDSLWVGSKYYKRYRIRHINQTKRKTHNMRKKIVAGNWKMNLNLQEGVALANELKDALAAEKPNCDVIICTPFIHLATVAGITEGTVIGLGAENCADKASGAYTGEVSASQVKSTGAQYVILGHSERRAYYGETAEILKEKVNMALANDLKVIFCIGEVLEEREAEKQNEVVGAQLADSLFDLTEEQLSNVILAYEPVWAIGTGKTATAEQAQDMHAFIRGVIAGRFGEKAAEEISILYGGSCKPSNAKEIFSKPDVDGGLIGGAALKCADFKGIIDAWN